MCESAARLPIQPRHSGDLPSRGSWIVQFVGGALVGALVRAPAAHARAAASGRGRNTYGQTLLCSQASEHAWLPPVGFRGAVLVGMRILQRTVGWLVGSWRSCLKSACRVYDGGWCVGSRN